MTATSVQTLLQDALSLQTAIGLPPAAAVEWPAGERLPVIAVRPIWRVGPALDPAALARVAARQPRLGPELVVLYGAVGDGFRCPGIELPPLARLVEQLDAAGDAPALVTVCPNHPPVVLAVEPDGSSELRRLADDEEGDDEEEERWVSIGPAAEQFERMLRWPVGELRKKLSARRSLEAAVTALDLSRVSTPEELLAHFWAAARARASGLPALMALAEPRLRDLVEQVRPEQLSREAARNIVGQLTTFARHDLLARFGDACEHLFPLDDPTSLPWGPLMNKSVVLVVEPPGWQGAARTGAERTRRT